MIRRIARELVLQSLFQIDFAQVDCEAALNAAVEERSDKSAEKAKEYAQDVLNCEVSKKPLLVKFRNFFQPKKTPTS